ncbi:MAG: helix-turn-helix domain-containing protein [Candidatus Omnitrophica bacterium]|nr:helix-turn-helix domain-containing protein [Candidatus Omnitrophota bacterium]
MSKSFKYRLRLTEKQKSLCNQIAGSCRYVWNRGLALKKQAWEERKERISQIQKQRQTRLIPTSSGYNLNQSALQKGWPGPTA